MLYNLLGQTGLKVSAVVFGGIVNMDESQQDADRYVAEAIDRGINYFDVAPSYGNAELRLGPALEPYRRDVYLACKTTKRDAKGAKEEMDTSFRLLKTDHFDVFQLHALTTDADLDEAFGPGGIMELLVKAKEEGRVRHIGFSAHSEEVALRALTLYPFETVLFPMNWALGINTGWGDRIADEIKRRGIGLLAMKTLVRRKWREGEEKVYPKSWCQPVFGDEKLGVAAMKYGVLKGAATLVPPGNIEHLRFMMDHVDKVYGEALSEEEWAMLRNEAVKVKDELIF